MSAVSLPVSRPTGRALVVGSPSSRSGPLGTLQRLGFQCAETDDPYAAMAELCRRPLVYRALILSLQNFYREELQLIQLVKRRFPHIEIWLTQTDGRQASLAEAMRYGADGLLDEEGLHRTAVGAPSEIRNPEPAPLPPAAPEPAPVEESVGIAEPVLTADELRALLQDQPSMPPSGDDR
jgi:hypothetical protein